MQGGGSHGKPFLLGELLAWIRAHGPWRWASAELSARGYSGRTLVTAVPYLWLLLFFLVPFLIVLKISVSEIRLAMPPYEPLVTWISDNVVGLRINFENYAFLLKDSLYWKSFLNSISTAAISTVICLLIGYPMAYGIARSPAGWRNLLLLLVMLPFWTSFLMRVYAWMGILRNNGVLNNVLMALGLIDEPIDMLNTNFAVYIGIVYSYLPFMVLPLYANLVEARQLACSRPRPTSAASAWSRLSGSITVPLSKAGIIAGCMLVFIPAVGEFVIPELLGGPETLMIGRVLWEEFFNNRDWPVASRGGDRDAVRADDRRS